MTSEIDQPENDPNLYPVTEVGGHDPASLDDFVGATTVTVDNNGHQHDLLGAGAKIGQSVIFFPRDGGSVEQDAVWAISEQSTGNIVAQPMLPPGGDRTSAPAAGDLRDRQD